MQGDASLAGKVEIGFIITPKGQVTGAKVTRSSLGNKEVEGCIATAVNRWLFPMPKGGGVVAVKYPFMLGGEKEVKKKAATVDDEKPSTSTSTVVPLVSGDKEKKVSTVGSTESGGKEKLAVDPRSPESDGGCRVGGAGGLGWLGIVWLLVLVRRRAKKT